MSGISAFCARPAGSRRPALRRQDSGPTFDPQPSPCMTSHNVSERAHSRLLSLFVGLTHYERMIRCYGGRGSAPLTL
eukprot:2326811-Prymnesium_polylepis.1